MKILISFILFIKENVMWYFVWILGVLLVCFFGIINVMWLELMENMDRFED